MLIPRPFPVLLCVAAALAGASGPLRAETPTPAAAPASRVQWQEWSAELPARAKQAGLPLYLFAGSQLNELTRATLRQTFANAETADFLNRRFLCVMVDTDERGALAAIVRRHLSLLHQAEGLPVHLWLSPDLAVIEISAYLPPTEEWGKPGFLKVATQVDDAWRADPQGAMAKVADALAHTAEPAERPAVPVVDSAAIGRTLDQAAERWRQSADTANGGFGEAPKHPQPEVLRFLLSRPGPDSDLARATLLRMANSALRDPLDGGFFRYATDPGWRLPYLQKLLSDQARLALAYLDADALAPDPALREAACGALDYALARLALPSGGYAFAEDGSAEPGPAAYLWSTADLAAPLGADAPGFFARHGVQADGNITEDIDPGARWKGLNVLASALPSTPEDRLQLATLAARRADRAAPLRDERAFLAPQSLLLAALSQAAAQYDEPHYHTAATTLFNTLRTSFIPEAGGAVRRSTASTEAATPTDRAAFAYGCQAYGVAFADAPARTLALTLLASLVADSFDEAAGCFVITPPAPKTGFLTFRTPAPTDLSAAEALALLAGLEGPAAARLRAGLVARLESEEETDTGSLLHALATARSRE